MSISYVIAMAIAQAIISLYEFLSLSISNVKSVVILLWIINKVRGK